MFKNLLTVTAAIACMGLFAAGSASAGSSVSAPSKYRNATRVASVDQVRTHRQARSSDFGITSFSSSSAKSSVPKR